MSADVSMAESDVTVDDDLVFEEEGGIRIGDIYIPPPPPPALTFDAKGPRLIISGITNVNFKSYVGTHSLGPFHKSFTCIVGPNGSGKSNCIDSMLFVFGHRAQKIRSKKIGSLIHNSEQHKNVESCSVGIHFKKIIDLPDDKMEDVPGSEFTISRTASRDNSSYYSIDNKRCQYKDVTLLLRSHGIDIDHNRFLILQGEVEQIAMMKPKALTEHDTGMLEYLEDIVGSSRFKVPIEKLSKRVEELNEQRGEKLNRVKVVEKEKEDLEDVRNEAIEYLKIENDLTKKKNLLYNFYVCESSSKEVVCNEEKVKVDAVMAEIVSQHNELHSKQKSLEKELKKHSHEYDKVTNQLEDMKAKFSNYETQDVRCREDTKHAFTKKNKLTQNLNQEKKQLSELEKKPEEHEKLIAELQEKRKSLEAKQKKQEESVSEVMASLHLETKELQESKDTFETQLMELQKEVDKTKSEMELISSELDIYLSNEQTEKTKLQDMQKNFDHVKASLEGRLRELEEFKKDIPKGEENFEAKKGKLNDVILKEQAVSNELHAKRLKMEEARNALHASRSQSNVLNAIMEQKTNGNIKGIFGRLGDLGAIDDKYDVSISTACGALDYIVTESIDTAQECVDYLKRNNIGHATFIGLDKMRTWIPYTQRRIETPEGVPRLFDLVRVQDERIKPAFYYALRDTLVADNLDQATRIAFAGNTRYRVVTLQGQLIEQSGTMSGGGSRVSRGRMGSKIMTMEFSANQVETMATEVEALSKNAADLKQNKLNLEETVETQFRFLDEMKHKLEKCKMEVEALTLQDKSLKDQIIVQGDRVKAAAPDKKKVKQLQATVSEKKKAYEKAAAAASIIEADVQRLHKEIMAITGGRMQTVQNKLDEINKKIDEVDGSITKSTVAIKTVSRNLKKVSTKIKNMEIEITENNDKIDKLVNENKKIEVEAGKLIEEIGNLKTIQEERQKELSGLRGELKKLQEEENGLNNKKLDVGHNLEQLTVQLRDLRNKIALWKKELKKLALQVIDGEEAEELQGFVPEELAEVNPKEIQYAISLLEEKIKQMKPNMSAIAEYRKKERQYLDRVGELEAITEQRDSQRQVHDNLRKQRLQDFMTGFGIITNKLKEMYQMITLGGDAELELVDSLDPFSEGIVFSVRPPKKSWKNISNLSGGEKTLSSLALVFALHYYKPTPFYFMDEIDAALDFKNVSIVAHYIKERTKNAQFIIISLRNNMFELADCLVGIYKTYNCTKSVRILPKKIEDLAKAFNEQNVNCA